MPISTDYTYFQSWYPSGTGGSGQKILQTVKPYIGASDHWFIYVVFRLTSLNDARSKPLVSTGRFYDGWQQYYVNGWALWLDSNYNLSFRMSSTYGSTRYTLADYDTYQKYTGSGGIITKTNTFYVALVSKYGETFDIGVKEVYDDSVRYKQSRSGYFETFVDTTGLTVYAGSDEEGEQGFPGWVETVKIGKYDTYSLITDIIRSPMEKGSQTVINLVGNIGFFPNTMTGSLTSSNPSVVNIEPYPNNQYLIRPLSTGNTTIQSITLDTNGFFTPINTSLEVTVIVSTVTPTLGDFNMVRTFGDSAFTIDQPGSNSPGTFTYAVISGTDVISIGPDGNGTTVTIAKAGTATVRASQAASGNYLATTKDATITINRATSSLTVTKNKYITKYILNGIVNFDVFSTNASGYTRQFSSNNDGVITTLPDTSSPNVKITGPGRTTVNVTQNETTNYLAVTRNAIIEFVIVGQNQTYTSDDMTGVNLSETNLSTTTFSNCNLTGVNLYGVTVNSSTNFTNSNLSNVQSGRILGNTTLFPSGYQLI